MPALRNGKVGWLGAAGQISLSVPLFAARWTFLGLFGGFWVLLG